MNDDAQLLRRFAERHCEEAFAELVRRHVDLVHSAALRQVGGDAHRAEDVTQAVFVELARQAARLGQHRSLAGWLYTTARHVAARAQRAERRRALREQAAHAMNPPLDPGDTSWTELRPWLDDAMQCLSEADRTAIVLRFFQDQPLVRVGEALGASENAARMRVERAVERLRRVLARRGVVSSAVALGAVLRAHAVAPAPAGLGAKIALSLGATPLPVTGFASGSGSGWGWGTFCDWVARYSWLMTTKQWFTVSALVIAGAATLPRLRPPRPVVPTVEVAYTTPVPSVVPVVAMNEETSGPSFRWASLESDDYRQFAANLRASGAPERLVRDVVALELYRAYLPRLWEHGVRPGSGEYWRKVSTAGPTEAQARELSRILAEMRAMLRSLFGDGGSVNDAVNLLHCQPDFDSVRLAWLSPETAARAAAILEPILERQRQETGSVETGADQERKLREQLAALREVLSPEEREQYRLRESTEAMSLKALLRYWDTTETEFMRLADRHDHSLFAPARRWEDLAEREAKAVQLLGAERGADFVKATDLSYGYARAMAVAGTVAPEVPDRVWALKREVLAEDQRLRTAPGLSVDERQRARAALSARAKESMTALVGANGMRSMRLDWAWWKALDARESDGGTAR